MSERLQNEEAAARPASSLPPDEPSTDKAAAADGQHDETPVAPAAVPSATVGTGSYIGLSCAVMMGLLTLILIAGLLISRWLF